MPEALPELVPLALLFLCFALVWAARKLLAAMFGTLVDAVNAVHIPYLGGAISGALHAMEQAIDHALGSVEHGIDSLMGSCWHRFAQLNHWLWDEFRQHSLIGWLLSQEIALLSHGYHYLHGRVSDLTDSHAGNTARLKALEKEYAGIDQEIRTLKKEYHGIDKIHVGARLGTLEREAANIENVQIPAIRSAESDASDAISNLYEWAKGKAALLGVGTFAAAVAVALGSLGLGNLTCRNFKNLLGKFGCGLGTLIDGLLGIMVSIIGLELVCDYLPFIEAAFGAIEGPMVKLLNEVPLGRCEIPPKSWATLAVKRGPLPPPQTLGRLAA